MKVKLGQKVKDVITGFTGIITGHVEYISGCNQSLLQPPVKPDGDYVESRWFDDDRMLMVDEKPVELPIENPGFDTAAPRR